MWKSTLKCNHAKKNSVKLHIWIWPNLLLEMHVFLSLGGISKLCGLNEICRVPFYLVFTLSNIFSMQLIIFEIFCLEDRPTLKDYNFWRNPSKSEVSKPNGRLNPSLSVLADNSGAKLRENLLFAI